MLESASGGRFQFTTLGLKVIGQPNSVHWPSGYESSESPAIVCSCIQNRVFYFLPSKSFCA